MISSPDPAQPPEDGQHPDFSKLDSVSFDRFLDALNPFGKEGPGSPIDLSAVRFITPAALVQLVALCHSMAKAGRHPTIVTSDEAVRRYLLRSGFVRAVTGVADIKPEITPALAFLYAGFRGSNPMLVEVTRIETGAALPPLLDQFVWVLRYRLKYRKHDAFDVTTAVSELCQNTFDHNSGTPGFVAMQVYGKGAKRFLEVGVSDLGAGLTETLRRNPKNGLVRSDLEAIKLATKLGTSEHDDPTRGTGLFHLLEITYQHKGSAQIKSGRSKIRFRMDKQQGWAFGVSATPGVHVAITLPAKTTA